jgi:hypothetical protein
VGDNDSVRDTFKLFEQLQGDIRLAWPVEIQPDVRVHEEQFLDSGHGRVFTTITTAASLGCI